jgi:hypothetical protein
MVETAKSEAELDERRLKGDEAYLRHLYTKIATLESLGDTKGVEEAKKELEEARKFNEELKAEAEARFGDTVALRDPDKPDALAPEDIGPTPAATEPTEGSRVKRGEDPSKAKAAAGQSASDKRERATAAKK